MLANITGDWPYILIAVIILFGGSQLPKLARNAGEAMKEFKKAHEEASSSPLASSGNMGQTSTAAAPAPPAPQRLPQLRSRRRASPRRDERSNADTRSELDALLADREARAKAHAAPRAPKADPTGPYGVVVGAATPRCPRRLHGLRDQARYFRREMPARLGAAG